MQTRFINIYILFFFLFNKFVFCQKTLSPLKQAIKDKTEKHVSNSKFKKIRDYFFKDQWDSILTNTLIKKKGKEEIKELSDYYHFFRGLSLRKKRVVKEAEKEFSLISSDFTFNMYIEMCLAGFEFNKKNYKKALTYYKQIENIDSKKISFIRINNIKQNIGLCYLLLKEYSKAEPYLLLSLKEQEKNKDSRLIIGYLNVANLYYRQDERKTAIPYFEKAYKLAKQIGSFSIKKGTALNMAQIEEDRKNYKKALDYRDEMEQWKDSINDQNKIYAVAQAEKEFAVKEKQKEVTLLETENKLKETQRNNVIYIAGGLLLLLLASGYFYSQKVKNNKIIAHQKENLDALNTTKDKLFSIVSHDLRSSVNALKSSNNVLLDNLESKNIDALGSLLKKNSAIVNGAYGLLDNLLNWALLQTQQGYFHPTSMRLFTIVEHVVYNYKPLLLEKELDFENTIAKKDQAFADQESLKIVLRNLLDNAIKFSKPNGSIKIYSQASTDGFCNLVVEDTGLGMSKATRLQLLKEDGLLTKKEHEEVIGTGLGLSLVKSMIKKNNGKFTIESELGKGTKMIVSLPKTKGNE